MIGPFKSALGGFRWIYVIIDKFSKWIEYKPLVKGTAKKAAELLDEMPNSIITDLGSTFTGNDFWNFCDDRGIVVKYVSVAHPRANEQVERANNMVLDVLKKRLYKENDKHLGRWLKELSAMIWGLRTQPSRNTSISPYFMVFGSEAVLPVNIAFQSPRVENHDEKSDEARELEVNCAEETCACTAKYLEGLRRYYNHNIKDRFFMVGYLVLRRKQKTEGLHKLLSYWEGPYMVKAVTRPTSYRLCDLDGVHVRLRRFYA
jgi:transposase InsO family protein